MRYGSRSTVTGLIRATLILAVGFATPVFADSEMSFRPDEVLVVFKPGARASDINFAHASAGGRVIKTIPRFGVQVVEVASGTVLDQLVVYQQNPNVKFAQPNYLRPLIRPLIIPNEGSFSPSLDVFDEQWSLNNTGQTLQTYTDPNFGTLVWPVIREDADIDMPEAWDITTGSANVQVAVLDSGVDCGHPDLIAKCRDEEDHVSATYNSGGDLIPELTDLIGHGTHVAGIIGMDTDNGRGGAGIGWNTKIGSFKVCYAETIIGIIIGSNCADSDIISGIDRVIELGDYHVINMSFGGGHSPAVEVALNSAFAAGIVLVAAAGNSGTWVPVYPAAYSNVVSVGATSPVGDRSSFSSFSREDTPEGEWVDLLAPGDPIISTVPGVFCGQAGSDCFQWLQGTSMAAPHVSGVTALVWSQLLTGDPNNANATANRDEVIRRLKDCADQTGAMGQDLLIWSGHGGLNAHGAVTCDGSQPPPPPGSNHIGDLDASVSSAIGNTWVSSVTVAVHDEDHANVGGVVVTILATYGTGSTTLQCTTGATGTCATANLAVHKKNATVSYSVSSLNVGYSFGNNHDPDGDSNGTEITVTKP